MGSDQKGIQRRESMGKKQMGEEDLLTEMLLEEIVVEGEELVKLK